MTLCRRMSRSYGEPHGEVLLCPRRRGDGFSDFVPATLSSAVMACPIIELPSSLDRGGPRRNDGPPSLLGAREEVILGGFVIRCQPYGIWWIRAPPGEPCRPPEPTLLRPARVRRAPIPERPQHGAEGPSLVGQRVLRPRRVLSVELPCDDAVLEQTTEPARERVRADPLERALEILKLPGPLEEEVSQNQNRPGFADDVERASDWAGGAVTRGHRAQS